MRAGLFVAAMIAAFATADCVANVSFSLGDELSSSIRRRDNAWSLLFAYDPKHSRVVEHIREVMEAATAMTALAAELNDQLLSASSDGDVASLVGSIPTRLEVLFTDGISYDPAEEKAYLELRNYAFGSGDGGVVVHFPEAVGRGTKDSSGAGVLQDLGVDRFPCLLLLKDGVVVEAINPDAKGSQIIRRLRAHIENYQDWETLARNSPIYPPPPLRSPDVDSASSTELQRSSSLVAETQLAPYFADAPGAAAIHNATSLTAKLVGNRPWAARSTSQLLADALHLLRASNDTSVIVVPSTAIVDPVFRRVLGGAGVHILRPSRGSSAHDLLFGEDKEIGVGNFLYVFTPEAWVPEAVRKARREEPHHQDHGLTEEVDANDLRDSADGEEGEEDALGEEDWVSVQRRRYPGLFSLTEHGLLPGAWLEQLRAARVAVVAVPHFSSRGAEQSPWWIGAPQQHQAVTASFGGAATNAIRSSISQSNAVQLSDLQRVASVALPPVVSGRNQLIALPAIAARAPCTVTLFLKEISDDASRPYEARLLRVASMPLIPKGAKQSLDTPPGAEESLTLGDLCTFAVLDADVHNRQFVSFGFLFKHLYRTANELREASQLFGRVGTGGRDPATNVRLKFSDHLLGIEHNNRKFKYPHTVLDVGLVAKYIRKVLSGDAPRSRVSEQHFGVKESGSAVLYGGASQWHPLVYSLPSGDDLLLDGLTDVTKDTLLVLVPNDVMRLCGTFQSHSAVASSFAGGFSNTARAARVGSLLPTHRLARICSAYTSAGEEERDLFTLVASKEQRRNALVSPTAASILTERYGGLLSALDDVLFRLASVGAGRRLQVFLWNADLNDFPPFIDPSKFAEVPNPKRSYTKRNNKGKKEEVHKEVSDVGTISNDDEVSAKLAKSLSGYLRRVLPNGPVRVGFVSARSKFDFISGGAGGHPATMRVIGVHDVTSLHNDENGNPRYLPVSQLSLGTDTKAPRIRLETFLRESSESISSFLDAEPNYSDPSDEDQPSVAASAQGEDDEF